jgi:Phosphotransferase enzyme family
LARYAANIVAIGDNPGYSRTYMCANSPSGPLFAWFSRDSRHSASAAYELEVRRLIGTSGALRSPPPLEWGTDWRIERWINTRPCQGRRALEAIVEAIHELQLLRLSEPPELGLVETRWGSFMRRLRVVGSDLPTRDYLSARKLLVRSRLPFVSAHGDFHRKHILLDEHETPWVIDWEMSGTRPAGFDLLYLWSDLERDDDREYLFELIVEMLGEKQREELLKLRFALLVRMIAAKLTDPEPRSRDPAGARKLLALLPSVRSAAGVR